MGELCFYIPPWDRGNLCFLFNLGGCAKWGQVTSLPHSTHTVRKTIKYTTNDRRQSIAEYAAYVSWHCLIPLLFLFRTRSSWRRCLTCWLIHRTFSTTQLKNPEKCFLNPLSASCVPKCWDSFALKKVFAGSLDFKSLAYIGYWLRQLVISKCHFCKTKAKPTVFILMKKVEDPWSNLFKKCITEALSEENHLWSGIGIRWDQLQVLALSVNLLIINSKTLHSPVGETSLFKALHANTWSVSYRTVAVSNNFYQTVMLYTDHQW